MTVKRICLFPHMGYLSETSRMVEAYKALRDLGVEPLVATHGGTYEWVLDYEGINYEIIEPRMSHEQCQALLIKPFNIVARRLDIEPIHSTLDMFMGDITIVTEAPEILGIEREDLEGWVPKKPFLFHDSPRLRYAGPMYAKLFGEVSEEMQNFLNAGGPTIFVALTSTREDYLRELVTVLLDLDIRLIVVSTVHKLGLEHERLFTTDHLPSHLIMPMVELAIIHGGQGSVQTAVASGTPVIGFPLQTEQMFNLELIQQYGAGINLPLQRLSQPEKIRDAVLTVLGDVSYKKNMEALRALQDKYNGPREVAHILLEAAMSGR
jgi:hypothetical protein